MEPSHVVEASDKADFNRSTTLRPFRNGNDTPFFRPQSSPAHGWRPVDPADALLTPARYYDSRKLDVAVATLLLIFVFPLMGLCALVVLCTSRGPLLFRHARIGRDGVVFQCLKFRTMVAGAEQGIDRVLAGSPERRNEWERLHKMKSDPRVTPVGAFMRRYCLDELPQLFNVLAGQMSIVGPRPIVAAEVEKYGGHFAAYCSLRPGLTGLWQVSGRHALPYEQRVELDASYARVRTLTVDLAILLKTIPIVLTGLNE